MDKADSDIEEIPIQKVPVVRETEFMGLPLQEVEQIKAAGRVGFVSMNLYEPPAGATWGVYNDRKIKDAWVKRLYTDFHRSYDNCTEEDCLEVGIKLEWLKDRNAVRRDYMCEIVE